MNSSLPPEDSRAAAVALITGCWSTQVIYTAVRLEVPDHLAHGLSEADEIARATNSHPRAMFRLLRALAALGLCQHLLADRFALTESGHLLRGDVPNSLAIVARHWGGRAWSAFTHLDESMKTGAAWKDSGREGFYSMAGRPDAAAVLNQSMVAQTAAVADVIIGAYDFSRFRTVTDLGGGYGALLATLLKAYPHIQGASADLAYMAKDAADFLRDAGVADRARFIPTDFFASVAPGADCYLLKFVIHDWNDTDATEILHNTRTAAGASGTILIIEQIAPERAEPATAHVTTMRADIHMMAVTGGMERTAAEYRRLLEGAGLKLIRVIPATPTFSIIEAAP